MAMTYFDILREKLDNAERNKKLKPKVNNKSNRNTDAPKQPKEPRKAIPARHIT